MYFEAVSNNSFKSEIERGRESKG